MTTFTIAAGASVNYHDAAFSTRAGNDQYNIGLGSTLTIDGDTRYGPNTTPTTGTLGASASSGNVVVDSSAVRLIPFTAGTGTVPAADTAISQGGVTSKLLGVWSSLTTPPLAVGAAMPTSGWFKVRQKAGGSFAAGALTGVATPASGPDVQGWIEIAGVTGGGFATAGTFCNYTTRGGWFELGMTTGAEQTFQAPCSVASTYYCGVFIETAVGSGTFEFWPAVGQLNNAPTDARGKVSFVDAAGVIRIGNNGTAAAGFLPAAGLRAVVPSNVFVTTNTTVGYAANAQYASAAAGSKFAFCKVNSFYGRADLEYSVWNAAAFASQFPFTSLVMNKCVVMDYQFSSSAAESWVVKNSGVGASGLDAGPPTAAILIGTGGPGLAGGTFDNVQIYAQTITGASVFALLTSLAANNTTLKNCRFIIGARTASTGNYAISFYSGISDGFTGENNEFIGCGLQLSTTNNGTLKNTRYADKFIGTQDATVPIIAATVGTGWVVDGLSWLVSTANACHPYSSILSHRGRLKFRNVGSAAAPLNLGSANVTGQTLVDGGSGAQFVKVHRVHTTLPRQSPNMQINAASVEIKNCTLPAALAYPNMVADVTQMVRASVSQVRVYAGVGLQYREYFTSDTTGELIFYGATNAGNSTFANVMTFTGGGYADGGGIVLVPAGASVIYETPWFVRGMTGFENASMFNVGGTAEYDIDRGAGFSGVWKSFVPTAPSALAAETVDPANGFRFRLRISAGGTDLSGYRPIRIRTTSTLAAQSAYLYPMDTSTVSVSNIVAGSAVKVTRVDTGALLFQGSESSGSVAFTTDYLGAVYVEARKASAAPFYQPWVAQVTIAGDTNITALQVRDDQ